MDYSIIPDLHGKRVLVVGGSKGIGKSIAEALASSSANVTVLSRTPIVDRITTKIEWLQCDLENSSESAQLIESWLAQHDGELDAVFFCAVKYGQARKKFLEVDRMEWEDLVSVNLLGLQTVLAQCLPALLKRPKSLFASMTSEVVFNAGPNRSAYASTKAAAYSLLESLAWELKTSSTNIVQLLPSDMVDTPGIRNRRPSNFDYSLYSSSSSFAPIAISLVNELGKGFHGHTLVIDPNGHISTMKEKFPNSQT